MFHSRIDGFSIWEGAANPGRARAEASDVGMFEKMNGLARYDEKKINKNDGRFTEKQPKLHLNEIQ